MIATNREQDRFMPDAGFTLLELLVVIVVLSIAAGLGGGLYAGTYQKVLVTRAARAVYTMARFARVAAIEEQATMRMVFDKTEKRVWLETLRFDPQSRSAEKVIVSNASCRPVRFSPQVDLESLLIQAQRGAAAATDEMREVLSFYADGTADSAAVQVGNGETHYSIGISPSTGRASYLRGEAKALVSQTIDLEAE